MRSVSFRSRPCRAMNSRAHTLLDSSRAAACVGPNTASPASRAAAAIVMKKKRAEKLGITPLAIFKSFVTVGVDPAIMGIGPLPAVQKLLRKNDLSIDDIDVFEVNEAFASQAVYVQKELGIPNDKLNVNGGAIALGHPIGASGARIVVTLLNALLTHNKTMGLAAVCHGVGGAAAIAIERV